MPLQNRVTPEGDIVAVPERGTFLGNRGGCFHKPDQTLGVSRWKSRAWITCLLEFKNRQRRVMQPNRYTELFFLDEVTALSAGHRPCFECRRPDAKAFFAAWKSGPDDPRVADMDTVLQVERVAPPRDKRTFEARLGNLPDGAMVLRDGAPHTLAGSHLLAWSHSGYIRALPFSPDDTHPVLTPATILEILTEGYRPHIHPSAKTLTGTDGFRISGEGQS